MRRILPLILVFVVSCGMNGCGFFAGTSLEPTAKQYYDYMVGRGSMRFSNFISPAYKAEIAPEDLSQLDSRFNPGKPNTRFQPIKLKNVAVSVDGIYALSRANPDLGGIYSKMDDVRWIKVGKSWYLYMNSEAEVAAYGPFPDSVPPPQFVEQPAQSE